MTDTGNMVAPPWLDETVGDVFDRGGHVVVGYYAVRGWTDFVRGLVSGRPDVAVFGLDPTLVELSEADNLRFPEWLKDGDERPALTVAGGSDALGVLRYLCWMAVFADAPVPLRPVDLVVTVESLGGVPLFVSGVAEARSGGPSGPMWRQTWEAGVRHGVAVEIDPEAEAVPAVVRHPGWVLADGRRLA